MGSVAGRYVPEYESRTTLQKQLLSRETSGAAPARSSAQAPAINTQKQRRLQYNYG